MVAAVKIRQEVTIRRSNNIVKLILEFKCNSYGDFHCTQPNGVPGKNVAMGAHSESKNRDDVSVTITSNNITTKVGESGKPHEFLLGGNATNGYTFYDPATNTYLALSSNSNEINELEEATTKNAWWDVSFSQNNVVISSKAYTSRSIMHNNSSAFFRTYTSAQTPVQLYKQQQSTGVEKTIYVPKVKERVAVHTIQGTLVRLTDDYSDALRDLPKGIYIINGRKIVIR